MNIQELAKHHEHDHPGYFLTDWYEAAFPAYQLKLGVTTLELRPVSAVEEFILRLLEAGVEEPAETARLLGISSELASAALRRLVLMGSVSIFAVKSNGTHETITITAKGRRLLQELVIKQPKVEPFGFCVDAITGDYFSNQRLFDPEHVKKNDFFTLPSLVDEPAIGTMDVNQLRRVWVDFKRTSGENIKEIEFIGPSDIESTVLGFRIFRVLQYVNSAGEVVVHVYDRQERSPSHELKIMEMHKRDGSLRLLRMERKPEGAKTEIANPIARFLSPPMLEVVRKKAEELPRLQDTVNEVQKKITSEVERIGSDTNHGEASNAYATINELRRQLELLQEQLEELRQLSPETEILSMIDHRPKLLEALGEAKRRVIIISPWLNRYAVDKELMRAIREAIRRGVEVVIGYGFGDDTPGQRYVLEQLRRIRDQYKTDLLRSIRLEESHAKILVCDDKYTISTSFNWLSFAGREDLGNRVEFGLLLRDRKVVEDTVNYIHTLFAQGVPQ